MFDFDLIIVGGGPAGMLAAVAASEFDLSIALLEKGPKLGRKMLITGGGRCNLTNIGDLEHFIKNIPGNGKFMYSAFSSFFNQDLLNLLKKLGVETKVEEKGKVYPVSDKAQTVVDALEGYLRSKGVKIFFANPVEKLIVEDGQCLGVQLENGKKILAASTILATGGVSFPHTGSSGDGYRMAKEVGHSITDLFPAAVSLVCLDPYIQNRGLQGLSLTDVSINVYDNKGKKIVEENGDIIFTHFGLSGPGALRVSRYIALSQRKSQAEYLKGSIDLWPQKKLGEIEKELKELLQQNSKKSLRNILKDYLPDRLALLCLEILHLPEELQGSQINKEQTKQISEFIKAIPLTIGGTRHLKEATVTGGGVKVKEVNAKTMSSKLLEGLFLAGEVLDIDAQTGGYNLQCAFSSGYLAGRSAAIKTLDFLKRNYFQAD